MESWGKAIEEACRGMMEIQRKILGELWEWDRNILGELEERIKKIRSDLERCRRMNISQESVNREHILCFKLE